MNKTLVTKMNGTAKLTTSVTDAVVEAAKAGLTIEEIRAIVEQVMTVAENCEE